MRLPDSAHTSRPWRIHELTSGFRLADVWALPTPGDPDAGRRWLALPGERVRQVTLPASARALSTFSRIDYHDAFLVETGPDHDRTAEQWARAMLEQAPVSTRNALARGWSMLGLRLGSARSDHCVLGWEIRRATPDAVLLGARGRLGLSGELLFARQQGALLFATFVRLDNVVARTLWAAIEPRHRRVVRHLLERAAA